MKVKELIQLIHDEQPLYNVYQADDIIGGKAKMVASNLNLDNYRWYTQGTNVYECEDGYVGVTGPCELYSETMNWRDLEMDCIAKEYIAVPTVTYKEK